MIKKQNIVSLLPAATEIVCLLGLKNSLVGVSDDSDYPLFVKKLPIVTTSTLASHLSSRQIDTQVKAAKHQGRSVFHIDRRLLTTLAPELILTQELCPVCAPSAGDIAETAKLIGSKATILSLEPHTMSDIFQNIQTIGRYVGVEKKAQTVNQRLQKRLEAITKKRTSQKIAPTVLVLEWLDPLMNAGHWVPEMIEVAGGTMMLSLKGERSKELSWEQVLRMDPDILIVAPCGFDIKRTLTEITLLIQRKGFKTLHAYKKKQIFLVDGNTYLTRPGPRIVDGVEIIAQILAPELFPRSYSRKAWQSIF